jgi:hypothetical protein
MDPLEVVECAVTGGELDNNKWWARVTIHKCPVCGRRVCEMLKGEGQLADAWPQRTKCRNKHEFQVAPYGWKPKTPTRELDPFDPEYDRLE